jgi:ribosomal protein S18 acetylase RimI-like enzyme
VSADEPSPGWVELRLPDDIDLRPIEDADLPFLERVYAGTRIEELAQTDWSDAQKAAFIGFQFKAQHAHYSAHYADADLLVIERAGCAVGRLYLHWRPTELRIVDIALLPAARGAGTGEALLRALLEAAAAKGKSVSIHVEQTNRAMGFYRRLGFHRVGEHGVYHLLEWRPDAA